MKRCANKPDEDSVERQFRSSMMSPASKLNDILQLAPSAFRDAAVAAVAKGLKAKEQFTSPAAAGLESRIDMMEEAVTELPTPEGNRLISGLCEEHVLLKKGGSFACTQSQLVLDSPVDQHSSTNESSFSATDNVIDPTVELKTKSKSNVSAGPSSLLLNDTVGTWHNSRAEAEHRFFGPHAMVKRNNKRRANVTSSKSAETKYVCKVKECRWFGILTTTSGETGCRARSTGAHNHRLLTWAEAIEKDQCNGLPPLLHEELERTLATDSETAPRDVCRKVTDLFSVSEEHKSLCRTADMRMKMQNKVCNRVNTQRRAAKQRAMSDTSSCVVTHVKKVPTKCTNDTLNFKKKFTLRFPPDCDPQLVLSEEHMQEIARNFHTQGTSGVPHKSGRPENDLFCLTVPSDSELPVNVSRKLSELRGKNKKTPINENTVVFSSLALLRNAVDMKVNLDFKVVGTLDGTHDITDNDHKLSVFGVNDFTKREKGGRQCCSNCFRPLVCALTPGEAEEAATLLLLSLQKAAKDLFGILRLHFHGGLLSDHSHAFSNAFAIVFPDATRATCYPHMLRKFRTDRTRKGNGEHAKHCQDCTFLSRVATHDVRRLHRSKTEDQFKLLGKLVLDAWRQAGEVRLADVFSRECANNPKFSKFHYTCLGEAGIAPQNNSHERMNLEMKGSVQFHGLVQQRVSVERALNFTLPKLVWTHSMERTCVNKEQAMLNESKALVPSVLEVCRHMKRHLDVREYKGGHLVNTDHFLGCKIDDTRTHRHENALRGTWSGPGGRRELSMMTSSLCFVKKFETENGVAVFAGDCEECWKTLKCPHAVYLQCQKDVQTRASITPNRKNARQEQIDKAREESRGAIPEQPTTGLGSVGSELFPLAETCGRSVSPVAVERMSSVVTKSRQWNNNQLIGHTRDSVFFQTCCPCMARGPIDGCNCNCHFAHV